MDVVCVVDDDPAVRKAVANLLKSEGYAPLCFASGESFLAAPALEDALCVILDLRMGGLQGHQVQRKLNARGQALPVICMSAHASDQAIAQALRQGAVQFIAKPFSAEVLLAAIARTRQAVP